MSTGWSLLLSAVLLAVNGFFVAAEFALVASRRHRLEQAAANGSRAARAALAGTRELSMMLAGAQLGITLSTLGLGALAEPALERLLHPVLHTVGLPDQVSYPVSFLIALVVVSLLHVVVGEMAPKSWAIADPERSAMLLALPFRAFTRATRPALAAFNGMANAVLRLLNVRPQDALAQAYGPRELHLLLEQSREHGLLPGDQHRMLTSMLRLQNTTVGQVMTPRAQAVTVPAGASAAEIERVSLTAGRSRLAVLEHGEVVGVVHVRDAARATSTARPATARTLMTAPFTLDSDVTVLDATRAMRDGRAQLAVAVRDGVPAGLVALEDMLEEVIGEFDDETDLTVSPTR